MGLDGKLPIVSAYGASPHRFRATYVEARGTRLIAPRWGRFSRRYLPHLPVIPVCLAHGEIGCAVNQDFRKNGHSERTGGNGDLLQRKRSDRMCLLRVGVSSRLRRRRWSVARLHLAQARPLGPRLPSWLFIEQDFQRRVLGSCKRIGDRYPLPDKSILHIFRQKQMAIRFRGGAQND